MFVFVPSVPSERWCLLIRLSSCVCAFAGALRWCFLRGLLDMYYIYGMLARCRGFSMVMWLYVLDWKAPLRGKGVDYLSISSPLAPIWLVPSRSRIPVACYSCLSVVSALNPFVYSPLYVPVHWTYALHTSQVESFSCRSVVRSMYLHWATH